MLIFFQYAAYTLTIILPCWGNAVPELKRSVRDEVELGIPHSSSSNSAVVYVQQTRFCYVYKESPGQVFLSSLVLSACLTWSENCDQDDIHWGEIYLPWSEVFVV